MAARISQKIKSGISHMFLLNASDPHFHQFCRAFGTKRDPISRTYNVLIVGDKGTGKTSFIGTLLGDKWAAEHKPTNEVKVHTLNFTTNYEGNIKFNCFECVDKAALTKERCTTAQCAVIMFDFTKLSSYQHVPTWYRDISRVKDMPMVLCGNKADAKKKEVLKERVKFHKKHGMNFYGISAKTNSNCKEAIEYLARKLTGDFCLRLE